MPPWNRRFRTWKPSLVGSMLNLGSVEWPKSIWSLNCLQVSCKLYIMFFLIQYDTHLICWSWLIISHAIHVWYIYLHLVDFHGKCRGFIPVPWMLWVLWLTFKFKLPASSMRDLDWGTPKWTEPLFPQKRSWWTKRGKTTWRTCLLQDTFNEVNISLRLNQPKLMGQDSSWFSAEIVTWFLIVNSFRVPPPKT